MRVSSRVVRNGFGDGAYSMLTGGRVDQVDGHNHDGARRNWAPAESTQKKERERQVKSPGFTPD